MASYLGAFPFPSLAPTILTIEAMLKIVVIMTERYGRVLKQGERDRGKLFYRSMAVFDRRVNFHERPTKDLQSSSEDQLEVSAPTVQDEKTPRTHLIGFSVDEPLNDSDEDEDDDNLALAALDSLDAIEVFSHDQRGDTNIRYSHVPTDNFRRLIMLLLIVAPLGPQENLSCYAQGLSEEKVKSLRRVADSILWAYAPDQNAGISYRNFIEISDASLPRMFDGLNPLFEHFLFSKNFDLSRRNRSHINNSAPEGQHSEEVEQAPRVALLPREGEILNSNVLSQLAFFMKGSEIFHRLLPLFFGEEAGYSLRSFEHKVFNWLAPTILLVAGTRLPEEPEGTRQRGFADSLPPKSFRNSSTGNSETSRVVFGAYLKVPWKHTHREPMGDDETLLFQLEPVHEVFRASKVIKDYATFDRNGLGLGNPVSPPKASSGISPQRALGPVSMFLDSSLEYGVFHHDSAGGGAFQNSQSRKTDWQDRFEIESLEVWGCGGDAEAQRQLDAIKFEAREAEARKNVALGKDRDTDRALLEMAGLVGKHNASGGSMG